MKNKKVNQGFPCFPRIAQKKGWLRILEATIAIMLVSGVLLVMYSRNVQTEDLSEQAYDLQKEVLADITLQDSLRQSALDDDEVSLNLFAGTKIPDAFDFRVRVCNLGDACNLNVTDVRETVSRGVDVYVQEVIIAGHPEEYDPKKVRVFLWEAA